MIIKSMLCPVGPRTIRPVIMALVTGLVASACGSATISPVDEKHPAHPAAPQAEMPPMPNTLGFVSKDASIVLIEEAAS